MKRQKRKKKFFKRLRNFVLFLFLFLVLSIYINNNLIFKPFLSYYGENRIEILCRECINTNLPTSFITKNTFSNIKVDSIDNRISQLKLHRKFFLIWSVDIQQKLSSRYILLNDQIRALDDESNLMDIPINEDEIQKQIPFLLPIEILNQIPSKSSLKESKDKEKKELENISEIDLNNIYQNEIRSFVDYLYKSDSSLGPKISLIQFFPLDGLRFYLFGKFYWINNRSNFAQIEKNIEKSEIYLKNKNKIQSYNEFDLRYENQIICRNNQ